ncbi:MAG: lipopolysaccharide biosynthesis protein [Pseudanabaena sp.]|jgi:teichuronic acid exporter|uniref:lipopolysaccharide biosynthesis protein n=1 Tax=Pseudanabaena mucicola TaxID=71190 RepID=UPI002A3CB4B7|nr:lipopolysaccharide biosynthesis protein [Pseudanabaena sp. M53BS1SP1A06MG]MCA6580963.1 lipopolysaccharide biosynthesis protein [Pseudanabaena sp. M34BS1SP1A06MG]MCA6586302.1 lipopolysaccharide biosynthesis protein [Pseudanabaena sp. M051S1SP1A06QC]MCA6593134.1 lipopolysaccharide biosynthesis protein [Pseudanabaena sp. M38BS1SP1A06MG]MCA6598444.1 lipopolysaccharide biosynthesis protein [Pseudanabaena sp. M046S1SP1A06QC]MCA6605676.1 lipopolysaccharide biosynthesis protein [Pseudanabaena sp. M
MGGFIVSAFDKLIDTIKQKLASRFLRNLGWLGLSELFIRISRLAATIVLARLLSKYDYGLAALVLTTNEFINVFTQNGIWDKLIQSDESDLKQLCQTAYCLNWIVCGALFITQCLISVPVAWFYKDNQIILPICIMALVYLMIPISLVQASLTQRENRLHVMALANGLQVSFDNILTIILAFCGLGMWAIVLPKVIVGPIWVIVHYFNNPWRPSRQFTIVNWQEIVRFGRSILGVKLMNTLRNNLDYLIAGRFIGVEALGIYYFAFNAGLGISMSAINAVDSALFPHLCAARSDPAQFKERYFSSLKTIAWIVFPLVLLQSIFAPIYVPIIFGQKWLPAIPILILICLSAIPRPFANAASKVLWALNKPDWDLRWNMFFTSFFAITLLIGVNWNIIGVAAAVLIAHVIALPLYSLWVTRNISKVMLKPSEVQP